MDTLVNVYNDREILTTHVTPLNGAHILKRGTVELHRGTERSLKAYIDRMVESGMYRRVN